MTKEEQEKLNYKKLQAEFDKVLLENQLKEKDISHYQERLNIERTKSNFEIRRFKQETIRLLLLTLISAGLPGLFIFLIKEKENSYEMNVELYRQFLVKKGEIFKKTSVQERSNAACDVCKEFSNSGVKQVENSMLQLNRLCTILDSLQRKEKQSNDTAHISNTVKTEIEKTERQTLRFKQLINTASKAQDNEAVGLYQDSLKKANKQLDTLISSNAALKNSVTASEHIMRTIIEQTKQASPVPTIFSKTKQYSLIGTTETKWCKDGYYIEFNNTLRIIAKDVDYKNGVVRVDFKNAYEPNDPIETGRTIQVGETYILDAKPYRYIITLNYIGSAGKNPFTKAGYFTVDTYKDSEL